MRPTAQRQDELRFPLDQLLGTESGVRILRTLSQIQVPLSATQIAETSRLSEPGTRRALARLTRTGFILRHGQGRQQLYSLRGGHIVDSLSALFDLEQERYRMLVAEIRSEIRGLEIEPQTVWMGPQSSSGHLELLFLTKSRQIGPTQRLLQSAVNHIEVKYDLIIDVRGFSQADEPEIAPDRTIYTALPMAVKGEALSHAEHELRSEQRSRLLVGLIADNPGIMRRAVNHLEELLRIGQGAADHDLREWLTILESYSPLRLGAFLGSDSERAKRLRQSSPFMPVLSTRERAELDRLVEEG
ncbi:MAG: DNA-binding transcriptional ArsR family regulator [Thalassolituus oleivorans]|jgi:DNA-binding transcriptional ArsR family regulator